MRLFIGIDLPYELKQRLVDFQSGLRELGVIGLWKSPQNFHITLEFLGEIEPHSIPSLKTALAQGTRNMRPFNLKVSGLGAFPSLQRPHTLWTAVKGGLNDLYRLRNAIHQELVISGFKLESRQFKPHITLASRPKLDQIDLSSSLSKELGEFTVQEVVLFESRVEGRQRIYTDLSKTILTSSRN